MSQQSSQPAVYLYPENHVFVDGQIKRLAKSFEVLYNVKKCVTRYGIISEQDRLGSCIAFTLIALLFPFGLFMLWLIGGSFLYRFTQGKLSTGEMLVAACLIPSTILPIFGGLSGIYRLIRLWLTEGEGGFAKRHYDKLLDEGKIIQAEVMRLSPIIVNDRVFSGEGTNLMYRFTNPNGVMKQGHYTIFVKDKTIDGSHIRIVYLNDDLHIPL